jgi:hypothetical protein
MVPTRSGPGDGVVSRRGSTRDGLISCRLQGSLRCTQGLWTRRRADEAMGTARAEAKTADKDVTQGHLHGRCPVVMKKDVRHQPVIRVVQHDTPKERTWPSGADRRSA